MIFLLNIFFYICVQWRKIDVLQGFAYKRLTLRNLSVICKMFSNKTNNTTVKGNIRGILTTQNIDDVVRFFIIIITFIEVIIIN